MVRSPNKKAAGKSMFGVQFRTILSGTIVLTMTGMLTAWCFIKPSIKHQWFSVGLLVISLLSTIGMIAAIRWKRPSLLWPFIIAHWTCGMITCFLGFLKFHWMSFHYNGNEISTHFIVASAMMLVSILYFIAFGLAVCARNQLKLTAPGLTPIFVVVPDGRDSYYDDARSGTTGTITTSASLNTLDFSTGV
ncbi:hypothetical protein M3Y94_00610600 [Aphelenchoides besseyi]|nr:hypothetical protein M3Y94_00610600 [Aphelenchoides besseyi]KAI6216941.1 hypothetical protein M3Y95_01249700 [Aphelenchoides besseyi]